jgi:hypothetical protein
MMYIMRIQSDDAIFQRDIEKVDKESTKIVRMTICSSVPIDYRILKDSDLEGEVVNVLIDVIGKPWKLNFGRISRLENYYVTQIITGEAFNEEDAYNYRETFGYLSLPYATIKPYSNPQKFDDKLINQCMHIFYGQYKERLLEVYKILNKVPMVCQ